MQVDSASRGVAFLCHPYHRGGVTRWMVDAAAEFRRRGTPAWFVAPEPRRPFPSGARRPTVMSLLRELAPNESPNLVAPAVGVEFELGTVAYRSSIYASAVVQGVPEGTPCIVSDDPSVWRGAARLRGRYPMIGVLHGDDEAYYALASEHDAALSACVAVSRRIAERVRRVGSAREIPVIPCGLPLRRFDPSGGPAQIPRLIWVGRMEEEFKRVSDLPLVAELLRGRGVSFTLDIVGDGSGEARLREMIEERELEPYVRLLGWREADDIWRLLSESDVMLLPSNREGMPIVMMEALAAGCTVVASRVSGVEDVTQLPLADGVLMAHEVGDVEQAASLVSQALLCPRAHRRAAARKFAEKHFAIGVCVDEYQRILEACRPAPAGARRGAFPTLAGAISLPLALARAARRALRAQ